MKTKEIESKTDAELAQELSKLKTELQELRTKLRMGQVKNVRQARVIRVTIARILTALHTR